jgi:hypothetical protein
MMLTFLMGIAACSAEVMGRVVVTVAPVANMHAARWEARGSLPTGVGHIPPSEDAPESPPQPPSVQGVPPSADDPSGEASEAAPPLPDPEPHASSIARLAARATSERPRRINDSYRQGVGPNDYAAGVGLSNDKTKLVHVFLPSWERALLSVACVAAVLGGLSQVPRVLARRVLACDRARAVCTLYVDSGFLGSEREEMPLPFLVRARVDSSPGGETDAPWDAVLETQRGDRVLRTCNHQPECESVVRQVTSFLGGAGEGLEVRSERSVTTLALILGITTLVALLGVLAPHRRVALSLDRDAGTVEVRWIPSLRRPVTLRIDGARVDVREKTGSDGETIITVALVSPGQEIVLGEGSTKKQRDLARDVSRLLSDSG